MTTNETTNQTATDETTTDDPQQAAATTPWGRLRVPLTILLVVVLGILYVVCLSGAGRGWQFWLSVGIGLVGLLALMVWVAFWSPLPRNGRILAVCVPPLLIGGFIALTKFEEYDGDSIPIWSTLTWQWTPPAHQRLAEARFKTTGQIELVPATNDFPQFLGPGRDGIVRGVRLSRDWKNHPPREVWRRPIGAGWSAFAIVGDYAFTQEQRDTKEIVSCYHLRTGDPEWFHEDVVGFVAGVGEGDGPRATPTVAGGRVYTVGGTGLVNCLDAATGERVWSRPALDDANTRWGKSDSPLVLEGLVIITGGKTGPSLIALNRETGEEVWTGQWDAKQPGTIADCYASPVLATLHGVPQILNLEDPGIAAYDVDSGRQLWRHAWPWHSGVGGHSKCTQPLPLPGNRVFFAAAYSSGCSLIDVRRNANGQFTTHKVWMNENLKTKFSNAVRRGDYLYGLHNHFLRCLDYKTGRLAWKAPTRYGHGQVLLADDLLLVQAERPGDIALVEATPKQYRELGRIEALKQTTWNNLALSGKYLLARNAHEAVCFELALVEPRIAAKRELDSKREKGEDTSKPSKEELPANVDVSKVSPKDIGVSFVEPSTEHSGFKIRGKNETVLIRNLQSLNGISIAALERQMRPGAEGPEGSTAGFLGPSERLLDVLAGDNAFVVDELKLTHQDLARPLLLLGYYARKHQYDARKIIGNRPMEVSYRSVRLKLRAISWKGSQYSPFKDGTETSTDVTIENVKTGKKLKYSLLVPHMIERYGFYEGKGTKYRVEPKAIIEVLELKRGS